MIAGSRVKEERRAVGLSAMTGRCRGIIAVREFPIGAGVYSKISADALPPGPEP
jgi:hypothetical protein